MNTNTRRSYSVIGGHNAHEILFSVMVIVIIEA